MVPTTAFATSNNNYSYETSWLDSILSFIFGKETAASYYGNSNTYKEVESYWNDKYEKDNGNKNKDKDNKDKDKDKDKDKYDDFWDDWNKKNKWKDKDPKDWDSADIWECWYTFPGLGWGVDGIPAKERGDFPGGGNTGGYFPGVGPQHDHRP